MTDRLLYVDRYICYEEVLLETAADYGLCTHWNQPYMNNANTILLFTGGNWRALIEGAECSLMPGDLCLIKCLESCMLHPQRYPCSMQRISFSPFYFRVIDPEMQLCRPFDAHPLGVGNPVRTSDYNAAHFFQNLQRVLTAGSDQSKRLALVAALIDFLYELSTTLDFSLAEDSRPKELCSILAHINAHYCEDIDLDTLTRQLYLSRSQLSKIMKRATGFTAWNYILNKRVYRAMQLIHAGMSPHETATAVGFRDYTTFYKAFQKIGVSPPTIERPSENEDPQLKHFYVQKEAADWMHRLYGISMESADSPKENM